MKNALNMLANTIMNEYNLDAAILECQFYGMQTVAGKAQVIECMGEKVVFYADDILTETILVCFSKADTSVRQAA